MSFHYPLRRFGNGGADWDHRWNPSFGCHSDRHRRRLLQGQPKQEGPA